ncbi:MAG TPA: ABC transporter permease [Hyphomonadaceae bacterium]|jgi:putative ABC transport system permease protein|nr:ABC transporter permease [Hyphomonadaceae bacterium]
MFRHYITTALANLLRRPFTTAAGILTLALGLACFIAAYGIATYWRSADSYHANAARTVVMAQSWTYVGEAPEQSTQSSHALPALLKADFPEVETTARAMEEADIPASAGSNRAIANTAAVDPEFLDIFDLPFVAGDPRTALAQPNGVVITSSLALRLFGQAPALGKSILLSGKEDLVVTGVIGPVRQPSFMGDGPDSILRFDLLRNLSSSPSGIALDRLPQQLNLAGGYNFVQLARGASIEAFNARLPAFVDRRITKEEKERVEVGLTAFPISEFAGRELDIALFAGTGPGLSTISILLGLGILTLAVACMNYAGLATALASGRAREVGMRRVLGAGVLAVMVQAWLEALALTLVAVVIAFAVLALAAPAVASSTGIDILYFMQGGLAPFGVIAGVIGAVSLAAGAYPGLVLSQVRPAAALRSGRSRSGSGAMARLLVGVQFASASFLLILVAVMYFQRAHLSDATLATRADPVVLLNDLRPIGVDYETLANRIVGRPGIKAVSVVDIPPWGALSNTQQVAATADAAAAKTGIRVKSIGYDYFEALNLKILAGREFDREHDTAPVSLYAFRVSQPVYSVVIDSRLAEHMGFATPEAAIGKTIWQPATATRAAHPLEIIGVAEPEAMRLEASDITGQVYSYATKAFWGQQRPIIRIDRSKTAEGLASVRQAWDGMTSGIQADIRFFDDLFEQSYRKYDRIGQLFILLASTAFVIASIGLLGIAVHSASRRRHEIAVRKTLGSSVAGVVNLLLTDFSVPVLIGNLIAWPLSYVAAQTYLSAFADRIELSPAPFLLSMAITLAIAWVAIIGVVLKAASVRPAEVLRRA